MAANSSHSPDESAVLAAPFGRLGVAAHAGVLTGIAFLPADTPLRAPISDGVCAQLAQELASYWDAPQHVFQLPWRAEGTLFQQRVWQVMLQIPPGQTLSYGQVAQQLASAPRAVGGACGRNPLPIVIPCHRIVAAGGLGGFNQGRDEGLLGVKRWLLRHEGALTGV